MRNKYLLLSIFLLFGCNQVDKKIPIEWEEGQYVKGNVKSIKETTYQAEEKFGEVSKGKFEKQFVVQYNEEGKISEFVSYDFAGSIQQKIAFIFDDKSNPIEKNNYDNEGNLKDKEISEFDENGNNISSKKLIEGGLLLEKFVSKFDNKNQKIEEIEYNSEGEIRGKYTYEYDTKGNRTKVNYYDRDLTLNREMTYKYDDNNNNTSILISKKEFDFTELKYTDKKEQEQREMKYDQSGNMIEMKRTKINEEREFTESATLKYKFDEKGNFLERILYVDGKAIRITEREIEYYENKFW